MGKEHYFRVAVGTETKFGWVGLDEILLDELKKYLENLRINVGAGSAVITGVHEITAYEYEKLAETAEGQKLIDREMEKIDVPQESTEAQYADDPKFREFVDRQFNDVATDAPFEDMVVFAFGGWQEAIEEFRKLYPKED